jgi:anti-sigma factor RsiW
MTSKHGRTPGRREAAARPGDCRARLEELFAYLDAELGPREARALERHLSGCDCCGTLADNVRKAIALCRSEGERDVPASVRRLARQQVADLLAREPATGSASPPRPARRAGPATGRARRDANRGIR